MTTTASWNPPAFAPETAVAADRRGAIAGRFCRACGEFYPLHRAAHSGKPLHGKDHVSAPCSHQGEAFASGAEWWEAAVRVLPVPVPSPSP